MRKLDPMDVLNGTTQCPDQDNQALVNDVIAWDKCNLTACLESLLHMEDAQKQTVHMLKRAYAIWQQLQDTYEQKKCQQSGISSKDFISLIMPEDKDVVKFTHNGV